MHLRDAPPGASGVDICFASRPSMNIEVSPLGFDLGMVPGLKKKVNDALADQVEKYFVVPNKEFVRIDHLYHSLR
eukprot:4218545-Pyramimonas_sp.AAC.1